MGRLSRVSLSGKACSCRYPPAHTLAAAALVTALRTALERLENVRVRVRGSGRGRGRGRGRVRVRVQVRVGVRVRLGLG